MGQGQRHIPSKTEPKYPPPPPGLFRNSDFVLFSPFVFSEILKPIWSRSEKYNVLACGRSRGYRGGGEGGGGGTCPSFGLPSLTFPDQDCYARSTVNSLYCGHPRDRELVSLIARVRKSGNLFISVKGL